MVSVDSGTWNHLTRISEQMGAGDLEDLVVQSPGRLKRYLPVLTPHLDPEQRKLLDGIMAIIELGRGAIVEKVRGA